MRLKSLRFDLHFAAYSLLKRYTKRDFISNKVKRIYELKDVEIRSFIIRKN